MNARTTTSLSMAFAAAVALADYRPMEIGKPYLENGSFEQLAKAGLEKVKRTCVTLTFDDCLKGHLSVAAPVLEKYGFTGCFTIITDKVGTPGHLTWDDIRELRRRGHEIASHTASHPSLVKLLAEKGADAVRSEVERSRDAIAEALGEAPKFLCHPFIAHNEEVDAIIRGCGMLPFCGPRCNTGSGMTPEAFAARTDGWIESRVDHMDLLFHGVSAETGGWSPVATAADFEAMIRGLRERKDRDVVEVVPYEKYEAWYGKVGK